MPIQKLSPNFEESVGVEANNYQYNGIEVVEDFGLHVNHAQFRTLDPQTGTWWQIDPKPVYTNSNYTAMANNPIRYSDVLGDTIRTHFVNNSHTAHAYNLWMSTEEGAKFAKQYNEGGKYGHILVEFTDNRMFENGTTQMYYVDKRNKSTMVVPEGELPNDFINAGNGETEDGFIKFIVNVDFTYNPSINSDCGTQLATFANTFQHESQHVNLYVKDLLTQGVRSKPGIHHYRMRSGKLYAERERMLRELKPFWQKNYEDREREKGKSESDFINDITNEFY